RNSLIHALPMDGVYSGSVPGTTGIFEWAGTSPQIALYNNVFRVDQNSNELYLAPPADKLVDCANNIMIWLGSGPFPEPLPATFNGKPCFSLMTGQAGLDYWNTAVARWKASHATALPDIAPPVVSLFSPGAVGGTTLAGLVSLTATAADDHGVAAVQFQLDGRAIGLPLTLDSPPTKYTLSWDSSSVPNGTYTLTATATDTAGNTTTSVGIAVTISNRPLPVSVLWAGPGCATYHSPQPPHRSAVMNLWTILAWVGRIGFAAFFVRAGVSHFTNKGVTGYAQAKGVPAAAAAVPASGVMLGVGGLVVLFSWHAIVGAALLVLFL